MNTRQLRSHLKSSDYDTIAGFSWLEILSTLGVETCPEPHKELKIGIIKYWVENADKKVFRDYSIATTYFTLEQYQSYKDAKIQNWNINNLEHCIGRFGDAFGKIINDQHRQRRRETQAALYTVEYWVNKGMITEEAERKLNSHKEKTCGDRLNLFIKKYGEEEGRKRFKEFGDKSKHTLDSYIRKYGEKDGRTKFAALMKKRDSNSDDFFKTKYGDDWEKHRDERRKSTLINLSTYVQKYGEEEGSKLYEDLLTRRLSHSFAKGSASKESLVAFKHIISWCNENEIPFHVGVEGSSEYHVYDAERNKSRFYDFVIPELKLVFEYNGVHNHANPEWSEEQLSKWRCAYRGISARSAMEDDKEKAELIKDKRGFDVFYIYSDVFKENPEAVISKNIELLTQRKLNEN